MMELTVNNTPGEAPRAAGQQAAGKDIIRPTPTPGAGWGMRPPPPAIGAPGAPPTGKGEGRVTASPRSAPITDMSAAWETAGGRAGTAREGKTVFPPSSAFPRGYGGGAGMGGGAVFRAERCAARMLPCNAWPR